MKTERSVDVLGEKDNRERGGREGERMRVGVREAKVERAGRSLRG